MTQATSPMDSRSKYERGAFLGSAVIEAAASLSNEVILDYARIVNIHVPTWTDSAEITFQGIAEVDGDYLDVYDELGAEVKIPAGTHNKIYSVPDLAGFFAIKVRSGTAAAAQAQTNEETITVFGRR